jgi:hypothetical protein
LDKQGIFLLFPRGILESPPLERGGRYQLMSFVEKNMKRGREKRGKCKERKKAESLREKER